MKENTKVLIGLLELARHLQVTTTWLRKEADEGRLPHIRAGSQRLFYLPVVEDVLARRAGAQQEDANAPR